MKMPLGYLSSAKMRFLQDCRRKKRSGDRIQNGRRNDGIPSRVRNVLIKESSFVRPLQLFAAFCAALFIIAPSSAEVMQFDSAPLGRLPTSVYVEDGIRMTVPLDQIHIYSVDSPGPANDHTGGFSNVTEGSTEFQFDDGRSFDLVGFDAYNNGSAGSGTEFTVTGFLTAGGTITATFLDPLFQGFSEPFSDARFVGLDRISIRRTDGRRELIRYDNFTIVSAGSTSVPEPSSFAVLGLGGLAFVGYRRRRYRAAC